MQPTITVAPKKRNHFISYIKGYAIICVVLIHMIDWSNIVLTATGRWWKELLYPGVFFFIFTSGSVVYIAYNHYDTWKKPALKLIKRGAQIIGIYFLYSIIKLYIFDFTFEPYFWQYTQTGKMNLHNILTLQATSVPIGILVTIGALVMLSPILLAITKKIKFSNIFLSGLLVIIVYLAYFTNFSGPISNFLFSRNTIMFPLALWSIPFIIGYLVASLGFENKKLLWAGMFIPLAILYFLYLRQSGQSIIPSEYMYPLRAYYIIVSLAFMAVLFYIFYWLEKIKFKIIKYFLSLMRFLGDYTLSIYIWHWVAVDMTLWLFFPHYKMIFLTVSIVLALIVLLKKNKFLQYIENQV